FPRPRARARPRRRCARPAHGRSRRLEPGGPRRPLAGVLAARIPRTLRGVRSRRVRGPRAAGQPHRLHEKDRLNGASGAAAQQPLLLALPLALLLGLALVVLLLAP